MSLQVRKDTKKDFQNSKQQCLGKRDKSFAGRIDVHAVEICSVINDRTEYYTTSSCSGRAFLYRGHGVKALQYFVGGKMNERSEEEADYRASSFQRWRITHDLIQSPSRYFDLSTLDKDPTGGADPIRSIGQFEHREHHRPKDTLNQDQADWSQLVHEESDNNQICEARCLYPEDNQANTSIWLRMEPFILHVCCRSLASASTLLAVARPTFKNAGLTSWRTSNGSFVVAIWGDEGLDMPLSTPDGVPQFSSHLSWLQQLVNERLTRNWSKIRRFVNAVRAMPPESVDEQDIHPLCDDNQINPAPSRKVPSFDVIGDIAILNALPQEFEENDTKQLAELGHAILQKNKGIKICVARTRPLEGVERAPGELLHLAGAVRKPLITTHTEGGIKCVIDLEKCFFSSRMGPERRRICQQVARGERVLVLFAGVGMEALQIAGRTEAKEIVAIEWNQSAVSYAIKSHKLLARNRAVKCLAAADRLEIINGNVLDLLPTLSKNHFDRVLAPRPKEGAMDGDLGDGDSGMMFLEALLPVLKQDGGECHWYDFCAEREFPACDRTRELVSHVCNRQGLAVEVINISNAGSVAQRQFRVCVDFRLCGQQHNKLIDDST